ncbi:hypothetical protein ACT7CW_26970 [Bacillus pacificus]
MQAAGELRPTWPWTPRRARCNSVLRPAVRTARAGISSVQAISGVARKQALQHVRVLNAVFLKLTTAICRRSTAAGTSAETLHLFMGCAWPVYITNIEHKMLNLTKYVAPSCPFTSCLQDSIKVITIKYKAHLTWGCLSATAIFLCKSLFMNSLFEPT